MSSLNLFIILFKWGRKHIFFTKQEVENLVTLPSKQNYALGEKVTKLFTYSYVCWVLGGKWTFYLLEKKLPWCAIEYWRTQNF